MLAKGSSCNALSWNSRVNIEGMYYVAIGDLRMRIRHSFSIEVRPMMLYAPTGKLSALFYSNLQCFYGNFRGDNKLPGPGGIRKQRFNSEN